MADNIFIMTNQNKVIFSKKLELVIAFGKYNRVIPVRLNVSLRTGDSIFGVQLIWQLIFEEGEDKELREFWDGKRMVGRKKSRYKKRSPENHVEFYFDEDYIEKNIKKIMTIVERWKDGKDENKDGSNL